MKSFVLQPRRWRSLLRGGRVLAGKLVRLTSKVWLVPISLEDLQPSSTRGGVTGNPGRPGVRWEDRTAPADQGAAPELLMTGDAQITYRLNLPDGAFFQARCRRRAGSGAAGGCRFTLIARPLDGGAEVRRELTLTKTDRARGTLFRVDLGPLVRQRIELLLKLDHPADGAETTGVWIHPRLVYTVPRPSLARRLRGRLSAASLKRFRGRLSGLFPVRQLSHGSAPAAETIPALVSILLAVGDQPERLRRAVTSVQTQSSPRWELLLITDANLPPDSRAWLEDAAASDRRIRLLPDAFGQGLQAAGTLVGVLHETDSLARGAVERVCAAFAAHPGADWLYVNEECVDEQGHRTEVRYKPMWGQDSLLSGLLPGRGCFYRYESIASVVGSDTELTTTVEMELALRLTERGQRAMPLPLVLYRTHRPAGVETRRQEEERAANSFFERAGTAARASAGDDPPYFHTTYRIKDSPLVSVILPTNGVRRIIDGRMTDLLATCVRSIVTKTDYPHFEVLCVDNANLQSETLAALDALCDPRVRVISFTAPFNLADKFNWAVGHARGEHLLLLNDDTEVITAGWMSAMLQLSQLPRVGAVGAKLLFPGGALQHAGVPMHRHIPGHRAYGLPGDLEKATPELHCVRNFSAVTGACLMTRRALYEQVGGFTRRFPINYNDVDYCLKVREAGHDVVYTPFAALWHFESLSREKGATTEEIDRVRAVWGHRVEDDPDERPAVWARGAAFNWLPG